MRPLRIMFTGILAALALPLAAQQGSTSNMDILRDKLKADRKVLVASNMNLTDAEGKGFWPIYDAYQKDLAALNDRMKTLIGDYAEDYNKKSVTESRAKSLLDRSLKIDADEVQLKRTYAAKLAGVIPNVKIARWVQIENKIRAVVRYELADNIPLVE